MTRARRQPDGAPAARERLRLEQQRALVEARLRRQVEQGQALIDVEIHDQATLDSWRARRKRWASFTKEVLVQAFNTDGPREEFHGALFPGGARLYVPGSAPSLEERVGEAKRNTVRAVDALESLIERLDILSDEVSTAGKATSEKQTESRRVFIVHGRDEGLRENVARVLDRLAFEPIILAQEANQGQTVIEKFEANALDVGFAVVILSPDDYGYGQDEAVPESPNRARQNVVLELGYFMGKLGRARVAALYKPGTELPSDIHGLAYVEIDASGAWRFRLATELAAAGYEVDLNRLR